MFRNFRSLLHTAVPAIFWTAAVSSGFLFFTTGCVFYNNFKERASRTDTASYQLDSGSRVELTTFNGKIEVQRNDKPGVWLERTVTCRGRTEQEALEGLDLIVPEVLNKEGRLLVRISQPATRKLQFQVDLVARVPERTDLVLHTSNGNVTMEGIQGDLEVRTTNGTVFASNGGLERVHLQTSNGKILARELAGEVRAQTSNGKVEIRGCPGKIDARTYNGTVEIDLEGKEVHQDIIAETSNGTVRCVLPGTYSGDVRARTSNGSIHCDFPITLESGKIGKERIRGTIGQGGPALQIRTSNGAIYIQRGDA